VASRTGRSTIAALAGAATLVGLGAVLIAKELSHRNSAPLESTPRTTSSSRAASPEAVTPVLAGHILDPNGDPVAGAHVRVMVRQAPVVLVVEEAATDGQGAFSFIRAGSERIRVEADHDPGGAVRSAELSVREGATTEVTLVLAPAGIRGTVVDANDGHPVAGVALSVEEVPWPVPGATSDEAGAYRFSMVPFDAVSLVAVAGGYRTARVSLGQRDEGPEPVLRVELHAGPPADGDVLDPDGKPLHAHVVACEGQPSETRIESADDGTFRLPASAVGCDAIATHDGMSPSDAVPVVEGRRTTLRLGAGGAIAGTVVDDRGTPIDSFSVGIESSVSPHGGSVRGGQPPAPFKGGVFRLERLVPGTYWLTASTQGRPPARSDAIEVRSAALTDGVKIVVAMGGVVVGHVIDDRRAPIAGAELRFDLVSAVAGSDATTRTDETGAYRLEGAPSGPFTLLAKKEGFRVKLLSGLWVESGRTLTKDVMLTPYDGGPGTEFGGIGAQLVPASGGIAFGAVFPGNPADRAGVRVGDRIVRIDGEDAAGLSVVDAIQRLRGEAGTSVGLTIAREGNTFDLVLVRGSIAH
jgi:hypothetical protein